MDLNALLDELADKDIRLQLHAGKLRCIGRNNSLTPALRAAIVEHKTPLVRLLEQAEKSTAAPPLIPRYASSAPLSFAQQMYWDIQGSDEYTRERLNLIAEFDLPQSVPLPMLVRALETLVRRCSVLRTVFSLAADGKPVQVIEDTAHITAADFLNRYEDFPENRRSDSRALIGSLQRYQFDLSSAPLFRIFSNNETGPVQKIILCIHRIVCDGASLALLRAELEQILQPNEQRTAAVSSLKYTDFAQWQIDNFSDGRLFHQNLEFWRACLPDPDIEWTVIPTENAESSASGDDAEILVYRLPAKLAELIFNYSAAEKISVFSIALATFKLFLSRNLNCKEVIIYTALSGRNLPNTQDMPGCFIRTVKLHTRIDEHLGLRALARQIGDKIVKIRSFLDIGNEYINDHRRIYARQNAARPPITFLMHNDGDEKLPTLRAGETAYMPSRNPDNFLFSFYNNQTDLFLTANYNTALYPRSTMASIQQDFIAYLKNQIPEA